MKNYRCYLFDADGTLIDTVELIYQCFVYTCGRFANRSISREEIRPWLGLTLRRLMERLFGPLSDERFEELRSAHMGHQMEIYPSYLRVFPGVAEGLITLHNKGIKLGVVSSRMLETLGLYLDTVGIRELFRVLVTPPDTVAHKPDPAPVLKALELLEAEAEGTVFIGDSAIDIECGNRAGVDTAWAGWGSNVPLSPAVKPTWHLKTMADLIDISDATGAGTAS